MYYNEDDMLMLSGIQHFRFCPRQWALIHIEQMWDDNRLTIEGQILHKHVDDPFYRQKCGEQITLRAVNIASHKLGLYGISDAIELFPSLSADDTIIFFICSPNKVSTSAEAVRVATFGLCCILL